MLKTITHYELVNDRDSTITTYAMAARQVLGGLANKNTDVDAKKLLLSIMQSRGWHQKKLPPKRAAFDKTLHSRGQMSYERCCWWLEQLGYKRIQNEIWEKNESTIADKEVKS